MNYNENFVKWITSLLLGIGCFITAFVILFIAVAFHEIAVEKDVMYYIMMGANVLFLILGWVCFIISSVVEMKWKHESKNKPEE